MNGGNTRRLHHASYLSGGGGGSSNDALSCVCLKLLSRLIRVAVLPEPLLRLPGMTIVRGGSGAKAVRINAARRAGLSRSKQTIAHPPPQNHGCVTYQVPKAGEVV
jgi:hypothetical protein